MTLSMSAMDAMPFDPIMSMGSKSSYWPGPLAPEPSVGTSSILGDLGSIAESEPSMTPPTGTRSLTSSPPRLSYTPDHREAKRLYERTRRDAKLATRMRRTSSNSTTSFMDSPPMMAEVIGLPVYTSHASSISLLSEPATSMPSYLSSYGTPPPMGDQPQGAHVFPTAYPAPMHPSYHMPMDYMTPYGTPSDYSARSSPASMSMPPDPSMMYQMPAVMPSNMNGVDAGHVRVVQSRPKPRCWEHGCNGRQFSTFSNLLRHQREKSGQASKASCPNCGAEFTRTTARNGHLLHDKCKQRRSNNGNTDITK